MYFHGYFLKSGNNMQVHLGEGDSGRSYTTGVSTGLQAIQDGQKRTLKSVGERRGTPSLSGFLPQTAFLPVS
jgi:hypothetical protein